jgi:Fe-S cluster biogenesis protein NfuA
MCDVCIDGGCSACEPSNDTLQFASMKEIEEFYDIHGEDMYVDPAELDLEDMEQYIDE